MSASLSVSASTGLVIHDLSVSYTTPEGKPLPVLGHINLHLQTGEFVCLVGPSGCGKSTLIRIVAGLQKPTQGSVSLNGEPITKPSPRVGLMFQEANLMPWRRVIDNIALPLELDGIHKRKRHAVARDLLDRLGLTEFARTYPRNLSGGMAQRVALGRVLASQPEVLLLDEPFGALDALTREQISFDLLRVWKQEGQTVLMVTHDLQEAVMLADRVLVMSKRPGQILADIHVPLPRPRLPEYAFTSEFTETLRQVREMINRQSISSADKP